MCSLYKDFLGFKPSEITMLTDAQASKANIMSSLKAMVAGAKAGKEVAGQHRVRCAQEVSLRPHRRRNARELSVAEAGGRHSSSITPVRRLGAPNDE